MPDELHRHTGLSIDRFLEGKDHQHLVDETANLIQPAFAPGPHLRAHVVDDGRPGVFDAPGEAQVEIGKVDEHSGGGRLSFDPVGEAPEHTVKLAEIADDFERSHDRGMADVAFQLDTRLTHALATEAINPAAGKYPKQAARDIRAVHVA